MSSRVSPCLPDRMRELVLLRTLSVAMSSASTVTLTPRQHDQPGAGEVHTAWLTAQTGGESVTG